MWQWCAAVSAGVAVWAIIPRNGAPAFDARGGQRLAWVRAGRAGVPVRLQALAGVTAGVLGGFLLSSIAGAVGWAGTPVVAVIGFVVIGRFEPAGVRCRRRALAADLPGTLDLMAACLESGAPLRQAVHEVAVVSSGEIAATLLRLDAMVGVGMSDSDAWCSLVTDPDWSATARDLARSASTGAGVAQMLRDHAKDRRSAQRRAQEAMARTVGVRSVMPLMCCFLPAFVLVGVVPIVAGTVSSLLHR